MSRRMVSCQLVSALLVSCLFGLSSRVLSCPLFSCHVLSSRVMSFRVVSCRVLSCQIVSCLVGLFSCHVTTCRVRSSKNVIGRLSFGRGRRVGSCACLRSAFGFVGSFFSGHAGGQPCPRVAPWCDGEAHGPNHVGHQGESIHPGWSRIFHSWRFLMLVSLLECGLKWPKPGKTPCHACEHL